MLSTRPLNLEEVGRLAGVSRSTVSRVLNGEPNVSDRARRKVEAVVAQTGYRPHAAARSLASQRSGVVGLVVSSPVDTIFDDPYFGRLMVGASAAADRNDLTLALFMMQSYESDHKGLIGRVMNPGLVDGVIVTASRMGDPLIEHLRGAAMPFVVVGRPDDPSAGASVDADNRGGARRAARHLVERGRSKIALLNAPPTSSAGVDRRLGFTEGLIASGFTLVAEAVGDWSQESGRVAMAELLAAGPDAVFVGSDRMAIGALAAIADAGLSCPDDVAVVSFDGLIPAAQTSPQLTSVAQPVREVGERAASLLHSVIAGLEPSQHIVLPTELVIRESCGGERS